MSEPGTVRARWHGSRRRSARSRRKKRAARHGRLGVEPAAVDPPGSPMKWAGEHLASAKEGGTAGTAYAGASSLRRGPQRDEGRSDRTPAYHPVPPQVDLPALEREVLEFWQRARDLRAVGRPQRRRRGRAVDLLRGPADRERHARHPPRRVADLQGRLPAVPDDAGLPGRPQGWLGLPRAARRAGGREGARLLRQGRHRGLRRRGVQRALPRVGAALRGRSSSR